MKKFLAYATFALSALAAVAATNQGVEARFEPSSVRPGSAARYVVTLRNVNASVRKSAIPIPDGLEVLGTSTSRKVMFVNGDRTRENTTSYTVAAHNEGSFTIPEWKITADGKTYAVPESTLKVDSSAPEESSATNNPFANGAFGGFFNTGAQSAQTQQANERERIDVQKFLRENTSFTIELPRKKIYVGETVPCTVVFKIKKDVLRRGFSLNEFTAMPSKADAFDCPAFAENSHKVDDTTEPDFVKVIFNTTITPLKEGKYTLEFEWQSVFTSMAAYGGDPFDSMFGGFFGMPQRTLFKTTTQHPPIEVSGLPQKGRPADFTDAIGNFAIESETLSSDALSVGEPCIITVKISGNGNFPRMSAPTLKADKSEWKIYKPKTSFDAESGTGGVKTFEFTAVPVKADIEYAPAAEFNFFDPQTGEYTYLTGKRLPVSVAPTERAKAREARKAIDEKPAIPEIKELPPSADAANASNPVWFWVLQATILASAAGFVAWKVRKIGIERNPELAKKLSCKKSASAALAAADKSAKDGNAEEFFKNAVAALQFTIAPHTQTAPEALLLKQARETLAKTTRNPSAIDGIDVFFEALDTLKYGRLNPDAYNLNALNAKLREIVKCAK